MDTVSKILQLIEQKGIEQQDLTAYLGINRGIVSDWKTGRSKSYRKYLDRIATYFDVSVDYLLHDDLAEFKTSKEPHQNIDAVFQLYVALCESGYIEPGKPIPQEKLDLLVEFIKSNVKFINK